MLIYLHYNTLIKSINVPQTIQFGFVMACITVLFCLLPEQVLGVIHQGKMIRKFDETCLNLGICDGDNIYVIHNSHPEYMKSSTLTTISDYYQWSAYRHDHLTWEELSSLSRVDYWSLSNDQLDGVCPLTQQRFDDKTEIVSLPCGHLFTRQPIFQWLGGSSSHCPVCKQSCRQVKNENVYSH